LADFKDIRLSTHCHNDLGLAVANSLAAVEAGARQVECTLNGIGERAGNCALEELIMALRTRSDLYGLETGIDTTRIAGASRTLSRATHSVVVRNKAVVGRNAFAHESGIHQHGMLNDARTYEIMRPQDVGLDQSQLVLGKHSGRHALIKQATALGYQLDEPSLCRVFAAFKTRADQVGEIDTHELRKLLQAATSQSDAPSSGWTLRTVSSQTSATSEARVALELSRDDREAPMLLTGSGPDVLDACLSALNTGFGRTAMIRDSEIIQAGFTFETGAFAELTLLFDHEEIRGRGRGPDPVWAAARALIDAFEKAPDGPGRAAALPTFSKDTHYETAC
ncbi:MAG: alpha-isopropylmalate synthase regulatory domain-containing protein, partial [Asticcacaulis sp.]